jgi:uncharacterized protein YukE
MTESEIHASPGRIQGLADELRTFVTNLRSEIEKMNSEFHSLGSTWRDNEYDKFKRTLDRLKAQIEEVVQEISRREPELKEDAEMLLAYINKSVS